MNAAAIAIASVFALQAPTFQTGTRLVEINVVVHDRNGVVADLTKDDFRLTDRGKPRDISMFVVSKPSQNGSPAPLPPGTFSNRPQNSAHQPNVTIVLLDALNTLHYGTTFKDLAGPTRFESQSLAFGKNHVMQFVKELNPNDRVAIYALGKSLRILCDFTAEPQQLQKILAAYRDSAVTLADVAEPPASQLPTQGDFNALTDFANAAAANLKNMDRTGLTMAALVAIANHAASIPGRKNLVWLTSGLPFSPPAVARLLSRAGIALYPVDARGLMTSFDPHYWPGGQDAMRELAEQTGGRAFVNTNDLSTAIRKAVDDGTVSYTLGFYVDADSLDGKFHGVRVHVARSGLEVRHPSGYLAAADERTAAQRQRIVRDVIASPLESSAIHILTQVDRAGKLLRVSGSIDVRNLELRETNGAHKGGVELLLVQQDAQGNMLEQSRSHINLALTADQYAATLKSGLFFRQNVPQNDRATTLRVIASDPANATAGSLIIPLSQVEARVQ